MVYLSRNKNGSKMQPQGFTLIELLVVIAIISILIGLLFPAVQYVREAAARTKCANNLKQMGLALQSYAGAHEKFPPAYAAPGRQPGWSWGTFILPYIEQDNHYEQADVRNRVFGDGSNPALPDEHSEMVLSTFRCPSNNAPELNPVRLDHALSNYRAVAGPNTFQYFIEDVDMGGIMYQNSSTRMRDIVDGTSQTLVIGECLFDETEDKWAALRMGMSGLRRNAVYVSDVMWWVDDESATINGPASQAFSSRHPGGALMAFADGSTRFFPEGGDVEILKFLAGRNDQTIVNNEF